MIVTDHAKGHHVLPKASEPGWIIWDTQTGRVFKSHKGVTVFPRPGDAKLAAGAHGLLTPRCPVTSVAHKRVPFNDQERFVCSKVVLNPIIGESE